MRRNVLSKLSRRGLNSKNDDSTYNDADIDQQSAIL